MKNSIFRLKATLILALFASNCVFAMDNNPGNKRSAGQDLGVQGSNKKQKTGAQDSQKIAGTMATALYPNQPRTQVSTTSSSSSPMPNYSSNLGQNRPMLSTSSINQPDMVLGSLADLEAKKNYVENQLSILGKKAPYSGGIEGVGDFYVNKIALEGELVRLNAQINSKRMLSNSAMPSSSSSWGQNRPMPSSSSSSNVISSANAVPRPASSVPKMVTLPSGIIMQEDKINQGLKDISWIKNTISGLKMNVEKSKNMVDLKKRSTSSGDLKLFATYIATQKELLTKQLSNLDSNLQIINQAQKDLPLWIKNRGDQILDEQKKLFEEQQKLLNDINQEIEPELQIQEQPSAISTDFVQPRIEPQSSSSSSSSEVVEAVPTVGAVNSSSQSISSSSSSDINQISRQEVPPRLNQLALASAALEKIKTKKRAHKKLEKIPELVDFIKKGVQQGKSIKSLVEEWNAKNSQNPELQVLYGSVLNYMRKKQRLLGNSVDEDSSDEIDESDSDDYAWGIKQSDPKLESLKNRNLNSSSTSSSTISSSNINQPVECSSSDLTRLSEADIDINKKNIVERTPGFFDFMQKEIIEKNRTITSAMKQWNKDNVNKQIPRGIVIAYMRKNKLGKYSGNTMIEDNDE